MRILIIDNDALLTGFVRKGLEAEHNTVDSAIDGAQGWSMALEDDYDLVIMDLNLPDVDGVSLLETIREHKPSVPVMILTAQSRVTDRMRCLDAGASDYVLKPFSFLELFARVRSLLRRPIGDHMNAVLSGTVREQSRR
jgi:DNA-binding response OmpR family regulator